MKNFLSIEFKNSEKKKIETYEFHQLYKYAQLIGKLCNEEMLENFYFLIDYSEITLNLLDNCIKANWLNIEEYQEYFEKIKDLLINNTINNEELHKELDMLRWMLQEYKKDYEEFRLTQVLW